MPGFNNTLLFAPALVAGRGELEEIAAAVDGALGRVVGIARSTTAA
jgi:taurine-pyruvate aminotransferase